VLDRAFASAAVRVLAGQSPSHPYQSVGY